LCVEEFKLYEEKLSLNFDRLFQTFWARIIWSGIFLSFRSFDQKILAKKYLTSEFITSLVQEDRKELRCIEFITKNSV